MKYLILFKSPTGRTHRAWQREQVEALAFAKAIVKANPSTSATVTNTDTNTIILETRRS